MMSNGGIYYIPLTVGDVQSRTSWSCVRTEIGMFDLKKQLFYCVFGLMCGCLVSIVLTLHNNGMIEYRRITLYQISQIHHLSRAKDSYSNIGNIVDTPFQGILFGLSKIDKSASPHYRIGELRVS